ncbi:MAG: hypothetical protein QM578_24985 [Pantoea sp.]
MKNTVNSGVWISSSMAIGMSAGAALGYIVPGLLIGALLGWFASSLR